MEKKKFTEKDLALSIFKHLICVLGPILIIILIPLLLGFPKKFSWILSAIAIIVISFLLNKYLKIKYRP